MDGVEGELHPEFAADIALDYLDDPWGAFTPFSVTANYSKLCLYHSRHYAKRSGVEPSRLCWADKLSIKYDPWWFYLFRAKLSGELTEYRTLHASMGEMEFKSDREWFEWASGRAITMGKNQNSSGISFHPDPTIGKERSE